MFVVLFLLYPPTDFVLTPSFQNLIGKPLISSDISFCYQLNLQMPFSLLCCFLFDWEQKWWFVAQWCFSVDMMIVLLPRVLVPDNV